MDTSHSQNQSERLGPSGNYENSNNGELPMLVLKSGSKKEIEVHEKAKSEMMRYIFFSLKCSASLISSTVG